MIFSIYDWVGNTLMNYIEQNEMQKNVNHPNLQNETNVRKK
jgi:hypothetical protein